MADDAPISSAPIQLPVINISKATPAVGREMIDAAKEYGFLYMDGAGTIFSKQDVDGAFGMARKFFRSPLEEKAEVKMDKHKNGWAGMHAETLDPEHQQRGDFKEVFNLRELRDGKPQQPIPKALVPQEAELLHFMALCQTTCDRILTLLALGLEIPPDFFTSRHSRSLGPSGCTLRLLYYPSLQSHSTSTFQHGVDVRAGAHSDYGSITLLFQRDGQPGLEVLTPRGEWAAVPVRPMTSSSPTMRAVAVEDDDTSFPPILVNIGDLLSYWTCGLLKSTVHRVVFPKDDKEQQQQQHPPQSQVIPGPTDDGTDPDPAARYSIAYFCHPADDTELVPVPSPLIEQRLQEQKLLDEKGNPITARGHLASRIAATYGVSK
ncbi:hypothetical protein AJ80_03937 [Polytolypa hystricis UAMH7299]|uniref:Fe2OG dioxygenase domain-containing protein n=1 Tax=Polytolypa hystricis (strain UAMH7299) TaxID=1447883 RepID=A0A2B7YD34_POLH7|nr:hypothetical protein AJ80_03937 [Polytolypa hystricis UAMH7299]